MFEFNLLAAVALAGSAGYVAWGVHRLYMAFGQCPQCHSRLNRAVAICPGCGCRRHEHAERRAKVQAIARRPATG
jgi:predicted amidophosphoribosyltransferase